MAYNNASIRNSHIYLNNLHHCGIFKFVNKKILKNLFKNVCFHLNFYSLNVSCLDLYQRSKKFAFYGPMAIPDTEYCRAILTFLLPEF